jgi:hypothetical protein
MKKDSVDNIYIKTKSNFFSKILKRLTKPAGDCVNPHDLVKQLMVNPQNADLQDVNWYAINGQMWLILLIAQPQLAQYCHWEKLSGRDWSQLLKVHPQFADKCAWNKL